ncbi:MAG: EAL domain-containing protein, partial [Wenzhouxiangellaceae bacterium]
WPFGYAFAVHEDRQQLAEWLQSQMVTAMGDGRYLALFERWADRLEPGVDPVPVAWRAALTALVILALAAALVVIWNISLREQVAARTRKVIQELDQRKMAERRARQLARLEPVTGLFNIRYFCGKLDDNLKNRSRNQPAELMLVRLQDLESVVRSFGYRIAENMVRSFGEALKQTFPEPVAHLGRGTYAVFDPEGTAHLQLDRLEQAVRGSESLVHPRFICGSAFWPEDDIEINELLHKAELALVESQARQGRWSRYRSHLQSDPLDLSIVDHFRRDDIQGLWFALQPQVTLPDQQCCGAELLARWQHPELGELSPARFVPLLENAGLVDRLTWKAIDAGVELLVKHGRQHPDMTLSVNVSARDLARADFHEQLQQRILAAGCPARQLKLEITETGLLNDRTLVRQNLERLSDLGVIFSIDDFGTGYSSLDYISRFPIREVKIDRTFVGRMLENPRDLSIVRSTIALAHEMDMRVVGEGAETKEHVARLIELECDLAQGWAIGYPMTPSSFFENWGRFQLPVHRQ